MNVDVLVLGGSMPAVVAALECAKLGLNVGMVFTELDLPNAAVTDADGSWAKLLTDLELPAPVATKQPATLIQNARGAATPVLPESFLGIPSSPLASEVVACIGQSAATRAYLDRIKPVLTIGKERHLAALVTKRMGSQVLNVLVEPLVYQRFGVTADAVDVAIAAPGLNEAITRTGSLSTGVLATFAALDERMRTFTLPAHDDLVAAVLKALRYWNVEVIEADPNDVDFTAPEWTHRALVVGGTPALANRIVGLDDLDLTEVAVRDRVVVTARTDAAVGLVTTGVAPTGERWSVDVIGEADDAQLIELCGPRALRRLADAQEVSPVEPSTVLQVLEDAGFEVVAPLEFIEHTVECARFTTLEEEHAREGILAVLAELDGQRVVGDWLHQGDSSAAITAAHAQAQSLRRELLGIS